MDAAAGVPALFGLLRLRLLLCCQPLLIHFIQRTDDALLEIPEHREPSLCPSYEFYGNPQERRNGDQFAGSFPPGRFEEKEPSFSAWWTRLIGRS